MTNLEAKQEAIKKAYGEHWNKVKNYVDENGWISCKDIDYHKDLGLMRDQIHYIDNGREWDNFEIISWRIPSLQGIENNNGWIRIESDEDLPKNDMYVRITFNKKVNIAFLCNGEFYNPNKVKYHKKGVTHYKPIEETNSPIF